MREAITLKRLLTQGRSFPLLWIGQITSAAGDWLAYVVLPLYVYSLTRSALSVGVLMACRVLPSILLGPLVGPLVDRWSKRGAMIVTDFIRGLLYILLLYASQAWHVYVITVLLAAASSVFGPALRSYVPRIVAADDLPVANSALSTARQVMMLIGPSMGGLVVALYGSHVALLLDAASFFVSLLAVAFAADGLVPGEAGAPAGRREAIPWVQSAREGVQYVRSLPDLLLVLSAGFVAALGYGMFNVLFPLLASTVFADRSSQAYGLIISCLGAGLTLGSAASGWLVQRVRFARLFGPAMALSGAALLFFSQSGLLGVALPFLIVTGFGDGIQEVSRLTYIQTRVDAQYHGRVFAFVESAMSLPVLAGMMGAGYLGELWGAKGVGLTAAVLIVSAGLAYAALAPRWPGQDVRSAA